MRLNDVAVFLCLDSYNIISRKEIDFLAINNFSFGINFDLHSLFETSSKGKLEEKPGAD